MSVSVDLADIGKLQTMLAGASNQVTDKMPGVLDAVADSVATRARSNAPVDQGALRADIGVKRKAGTAVNRTRWVGTDLKQGFFQEFGTSAHPPQPWLTPAANAGVETLADELARLGKPF